MYKIPKDALITLKISDMDKIVEDARHRGRIDMGDDVKRHLGISTNVSFDDVWCRLALKDEEVQ